MLLERESQLASLASQVTEAGAGRGSVVIVEGEAGSGKSSLLREAVQDVESWWGYCDPLTTPRPLGPLLDLAAVVGFAVPDDPFAAYDVLLQALRSRTTPVVVVIEDVHWADEATLAMLTYLGRRLPAARAVVVVTYRGDEVGPGLRRTLGELVRQPATRRLEVGPLSAAAVEQLASAAGMDGEDVHAATGGNAFFVSEVLASGGGLPASVRDAVLAHNERLSPEGRALVDLVSAEPRGLELALAPRPDAAAGVLSVEDGVVRFRHDLARRATYEAVPAPRRVELHRRLLQALEGSSDLARLAHHALGTGDPQVVVDVVWKAGREAVRRGAYQEALSFFQAVGRHESTLTGVQRAQILLDLGDALSRLDLQVRARDTAQRAVGEADRSGDVRLRGVALIALARATWRTGSAALAAELSERAVAVLNELGPTPELAHALRDLAQGHMLARHHLPALTRVRQASDVAARIGDEPGSIGAELVEGTIELVTGDPDRGVALLLSSLERARSRDDRTLASSALGMLGSGGGEARRYDEAYAWSEEVVAMARDRDHDYQVSYSRAWQARIRFEQGRWDDAAALVPELTPETAPNTTATALGVVGRLRVRRGEQEARAPLDEVAAMTGLELQHRWPALCGLAELHWLTGASDAGVEALRTAYAQALDTDSRWAQGEVGFWLWRCGGIDEPPPLAADPFAAHISGDWEHAAALWDAIGCPYERALALVDGDPEAALSGLEILDRLGARPAAAMARRRLAELGVTSPRPPRRTTLAHEHGLTEREAEVHALLRTGLTNAEIAERLYVSIRTVDHHVSAVLRKLNVSSRSALQDR